MLDKVLRLFNTLRYLKPTQLFYFILRRKFPARTVYASNNSQSQQRAWSRPLQLSRPIAIGGTRAGSNQIEFLNHARSFDLDNIDWCPIDAQRLWQYNLHYFDYLRDDDWSVAERQPCSAVGLMATPRQPSQGGSRLPAVCVLLTG